MNSVVRIPIFQSIHSTTYSPLPAQLPLNRASNECPPLRIYPSTTQTTQSTSTNQKYKYSSTILILESIIHFAIATHILFIIAALSNSSYMRIISRASALSSSKTTREKNFLRLSLANVALRCVPPIDKMLNLQRFHEFDKIHTDCRVVQVHDIADVQLLLFPTKSLLADRSTALHELSKVVDRVCFRR